MTIDLVDVLDRSRHKISILNEAKAEILQDIPDLITGQRVANEQLKSLWTYSQDQIRFLLGIAVIQLAAYCSAGKLDYQICRSITDAISKTCRQVSLKAVG